MDREAPADQDDRARRADLEALGHAFPGDRRDRPGPVGQHDPQVVLTVALLSALALAHHEGAADLVTVRELAQQDGLRRGWRAAVPVLEEGLSHHYLKVEAHPDRTLRRAPPRRARNPRSGKL